jgi:hypothetical protein
MLRQPSYGDAIVTESDMSSVSVYPRDPIVAFKTLDDAVDFACKLAERRKVRVWQTRNGLEFVPLVLDSEDIA